MANQRRCFDSYRIQYTTASGNQPLARIICYEGEDVAGMITFHQDEAIVPNAGVFQRDKIRIGYAIRRYSEVMDLLRNEEPLELYLDPEAGWGALLTCELEPVGEGDDRL